MSSAQNGTEFSANDYRYMSRALELARRGVYSCHPNPRVGCVIARNGEIIGEGWHEKAGEAHAEIMATRSAGNRIDGATVYVTLEPCSHHGRTPPCADALIDSGVAEVVTAMQDPNPLVAGNGIQKLRDAGIAVKVGLLRQQAEALNRGFISRMSRRRPWVTIKLGASLDGRTAMQSGESKWITGPEARGDVQKLRASSSAILTGSGTILADDPSLTVRLDGVAHQPLRVIVDTNLSVPDSARIFHDGSPLMIATGVNQEDDRFITLKQRGVDIRTFSNVAGKVDMQAVLECLASEYACNDVLIEAGSIVCGSLMDNQLVDEVVIYFAPVIMGTDARGMFAIPGLDRITDKIELTIKDVRAIGKDWRVTALPRYA